MIPNYIIHSLEFNTKMLNRVLSAKDENYTPAARDEFTAIYREKIAFCNNEIARIEKIYG